MRSPVRGLQASLSVFSQNPNWVQYYAGKLKENAVNCFKKTKLF